MTVEKRAIKMSRKQFILVVVLSFLIIGGAYSLYSFILEPDTPPGIKIFVGIFILIVLVVILINTYKKNVK